MTTQKDRSNRETDRRTSRHPRDRATGGSPSRWSRRVIRDEAPPVRRRAPAVQQGPSDAYSEGPSLLWGAVPALSLGVAGVPGAAVGTRSTDTDGLAPGPSVKMTPRSGGTSE
jgi:hypothetical protein